jgi:sialidase-1
MLFWVTANLTLRISFDAGKTRPQQHLIARSQDGKGDHAAYSDLVKAGRKHIGGFV